LSFAATEDQTVMRTFLDAKTMAKTLRESMRRREIELPHSECLEIVAAQFGFDDWNILAAKIGAAATRTPEARADHDDVSFDSAVPIMRIFAVDKAKEFYLDFLGFSLQWEHRITANSPLYAEICRSGLTLHLSEHHGDATPGSTVTVTIRGVDALHRELNGKQYTYAKPGIDDMPWGRVLQVADPFGNRLRFCEDKPWSAAKP
jgi:catechol 2,3-dioxygenase-like lactoylglutathione lyase family enzyme